MSKPAKSSESIETMAVLVDRIRTRTPVTREEAATFPSTLGTVALLRRLGLLPEWQSTTDMLRHRIAELEAQLAQQTPQNERPLRNERSDRPDVGMRYGRIERTIRS